MSFSGQDRKYLYEDEVDKLMKAASRHSKYPLRDKTMILMAYRHGLRATELCHMKWNQVDFRNWRLHVQRVKGSTDSVHPIRDQEIRLLKQIYKQRKDKNPYIFISERGSRMTPGNFLYLVRRLGEQANLQIDKVTPHMLRHATGYKLANSGVCTRTIQDYLGHASISNTVIYTRLSAAKFENLFLD